MFTFFEGETNKPAPLKNYEDEKGVKEKETYM